MPLIGRLNGGWVEIMFLPRISQSPDTSLYINDGYVSWNAFLKNVLLILFCPISSIYKHLRSRCCDGLLDNLAPIDKIQRIRNVFSFIIGKKIREKNFSGQSLKFRIQFRKYMGLLLCSFKYLVFFPKKSFFVRISDSSIISITFLISTMYVFHRYHVFRSMGFYRALEGELPVILGLTRWARAPICLTGRSQ